MNRFAQKFYETAANEVAQHNVVRGIMAKAFSRARGDEKKAVAYYIKYRAAQLAQEAREELRKKRREAMAVAKQPEISSVRLDYKALSALFSALFWGLTVTSGLLTIFFAIVGSGALNQSAPDSYAQQSQSAVAVFSFLMATAFGIATVACGYVAIRCVRAAKRK
jgi:predicted histidine transporter YuiF (NhaC family)